jgi:pimeloyl-ACP methyl ester carboxylesterase
MKPVCRFLLLLLLLPWTGYASGAETTTECVILLHGLLRSKFSMKALEWELVDQGYRVVNFSYPSTLYPIERLAGIAVEEGLQACREAGSAPISFVTHSLGGILVRQYLADHEIPELHRVVMLAPPNQGSQLADYVASLDWLDRIRPQVIGQLGTDGNSVPQRLGSVDFELGVIAGNTNRRPFTPGAPKQQSDGTVAVAETVIDGMEDFIVLPSTHTFIMWQSKVMEQVVHFLHNGHFLHEAERPDQ